MRIVDTSVLLPAVSPSQPQHETARTALEAAISDERPLFDLGGRQRPSATHHEARADALSRSTRLGDLVDDWLAHPRVRVVQETEEHARLWSEILRGASPEQLCADEVGEKVDGVSDVHVVHTPATQQHTVDAPVPPSGEILICPRPLRSFLADRARQRE